MDEGQDVNNGGGETQDQPESSPGSEEAQTQNASAGTEKTDAEKELEALERQGHVPYSRFKEVNQKMRDFEEKLKAFDGKEELLGFYSQFDQLLEGNPKLLEAIKQVIQEQGQPQGGEEQTPPNTAQQLVYNNYVSTFHSFCEQEKLPNELRPMVFEIAKNTLSAFNPDPLNNFDLGALNRALGVTKQFLDGLWKHKQASYVTTKKQDAVPASASHGGAAPTPSVGVLKTAEERAAAMSNLLKAGKYQL